MVGKVAALSSLMYEVFMYPTLLCYVIELASLLLAGSYSNSNSDVATVHYKQWLHKEIRIP